MSKSRAIREARAPLASLFGALATRGLHWGSSSTASKNTSPLAPVPRWVKSLRTMQPPDGLTVCPALPSIPVQSLRPPSIHSASMPTYLELGLVVQIRYGSTHMNTVPLNQQPAVARPPLERNPAHCLSPQRRLRRHCLRTTGPAARPSAQRETAWGTLRKAMSDHRNSLVSLAWPARGATSQGPSGVSTRAPGLHAEATALGAPRLQQELFSPPASFLVRGPGGGIAKDRASLSFCQACG